MLRPLESSGRLEAHLRDVALSIQRQVDRLHAVYPHRCPCVKVDWIDAVGLVNRLFRGGRYYVGSYEHGIDCPVLHEETIADAFDLFEKVCLLGQRRAALQGGISAGKSSVVHLLHFMMASLSAVYGLPCMSILFTNRTRHATCSAFDFLTAFDELYGLITVVRDGRRFPLGSFEQFGDLIGRNFHRKTNSLSTARRIAIEMEQAKLQPILLLDDAHLLPRFVGSDERLRLGPNVETVEAVFPRMVITTTRPELFWEYQPVALRRTQAYASVNLWYRGERRADVAPRLLSASQFDRLLNAPLNLQHQPQDVRHLLTWCDQQAITGIYLRTGTMARTDQLQAMLPSDVECIVCDHRVERSEASDQCWQAHRQQKRYAILSAGGFPCYHRSLPPSARMFIDCTSGGTAIANAAAGYDRANTLVVLGDAGTAHTRAKIAAHNRFRLSGTLRLDMPSAVSRWYDWTQKQNHDDDLEWRDRWVW